MRSSSTPLALVLFVAAVALVVLALVRDGVNTWLALAGLACAFGGALVGSRGRRTPRH
ncbi:hypothetical protein [Nocardioides sp. SYSU D00038]|uniref:hypothetical protein n=1 Tax=Nocardioides sp. SYSU D00038 TaxID=2812554 RepID=UPI0019681639|nr:hypothetical protein [Nocardioides sp. SYSU D00038]